MEDGRWARHFELSILLRKREWRSVPRLRALSLAYRETLRGAVSQERLRELYDLAATGGGGKYCGYQRVWNWNALAFQEFRFQGDFSAALACLRRARELVPALVTGRRFGLGQTECCEGVWLFLLLNEARLAVRAGDSRWTEAEAELGSLERFLRERSAASLAAFEFSWDPLRWRFSFAPDLLEFLCGKVAEERAALGRPSRDG